MVSQPAGTHGHEAPAPYDIVILKDGAPIGAAPLEPLMVADIVEHAPGVFEVHRLEGHPGYADWAAAVTVADIELITRITQGAARSWTPDRT